ncbi:MAG: rubrerythrin family protein [Clostridium sp.]
MKLAGSETEKNLYKTFAGESRARGKYNLFAEKAKAEGYVWVSHIFDEIAENEYAHSREAYKRFLENIETTEENLLKAACGENEEAEKIYKEFEEVARKEGFSEIETFYKELREVEESHRDKFLKLCELMKSKKMFKADSKISWHCLNCGYIHEGYEPPKVCPLCKYEKEYFKPDYETKKCKG